METEPGFLLEPNNIEKYEVLISSFDPEKLIECANVLVRELNNGLDLGSFAVFAARIASKADNLANRCEGPDNPHRPELRRLAEEHRYVILQIKLATSGFGNR